ncbi:MAG: hypothetical protein PVS3B3_20720 [Ktedonobacteraceae bacterium]
MRNPEQLDRNLGRGFRPLIASEALEPIETILGTSRTGKDEWRRDEGSRCSGPQMDLHELVRD